MRRTSAACLVLSAHLTLVAAASFTPDLKRVDPPGLQRGTEAELRLTGDRLDGPEELLFHKPGIEVIELKATGPKEVVAKVRVAPDAEPGEHPFRLRTTGGISFLRTVHIGLFPAVPETEPNDGFDSPQRIEPGTTVHGVARNEDEDVYSVVLRKGQPLSVEIEAMRLGRTFFDARVAILDPGRFELAACDDAPLLRTDAFASIVAPEDGEYRIVVREAAYQGGDDFAYRLHVGGFPRPSGVMPPGASPGETVDFRFVGDPGGPITRSISIPADASGLFPVFAERNGLLSPSPNWIVVSPLKAVEEAEPNNGPARATPAPEIPFAVHGCLSTDDEADWFRFSAKKGRNLEFAVRARHLRSPIDSVLAVHDGKGKRIDGNDDQGGPDSFLKWTCPADGEYALSIRDKLDRSGPDFIYRIEAVDRTPSISASLPVAERNGSQVRKVIAVPRGNRYATVVNISRVNLGGDVIFESESLPPGISLSAPTAGRALTGVPVVFEATADAPVGGGYHRFTVRTTGDGTPEVSGPLREEIHHVEVNNQGAYHSTSSEKIAVAVVDPAPFSVNLSAPAVPVVRHGTLRLKATVQRTEGFDGPVTLRFPWNPPGIGSPASVAVAKGETEAGYEINANADAPLGQWQVCVTADAGTPSGPVWISSGLVPLEVADPWLGATIDMAATEQGRDTAILCKFEQMKPFEGAARVELHGLPHGATAESADIGCDATDLTIPVTIAADAAVGKHNALFLRIHVPSSEGRTVLHQTGHGGTLRIDKPAPRETDAPASEKKVAKEGPAKPLSRLEQLRRKSE